MINEKKLVQFGAGKIGRSFIGQLFSLSGYEVVFIDVYKPVIDALNRRKKYQVIIKSEREEILDIRNVRGVHAANRSSVISEVATAGIVGVSTGIAGLSGVLVWLAEGLQQRFVADPDRPLDIIIAENMRNADQYFAENLKKLLPASYPFEELVGLIETSIGKMVPIMTRDDMEGDILKVFAEPYNSLILDRAGFKNEIPPIEGLSPKDNMKAWVDRKLFIHNLGHAAAAYLGYLYDPGLKYMYEILDIVEVFNEARATMLESADILLKLYPGDFTRSFLTEHTDDLLNRFRNKALGDTVYRVGTGLMRKLGPEDRLVSPIKAAIVSGLPYKHILSALVHGCHFGARDMDGNMNPEDLELRAYYEKGLAEVLEKVCGFHPGLQPEIFLEAEDLDRKTKKLPGA